LLAADSKHETQGDLEIASTFGALADDVSALRAGIIVTIVPSRTSSKVTLEGQGSRVACAGTGTQNLLSLGYKLR
jgi:hypothetical protein